MKSLEFTFIICLSTFIEFTSAHVHEIGSADELETILNDGNNKLVVLEFFATWCRHSKAIQPVFEALSDEMPDIVFLKVDIDKLRDVAGNYQITKKPTFLFIRNYQSIDGFIGNDPELLRELTNKYRHL